MFGIHMLPAEDGDCFLIETGDAPHRILLDGGRRATARTHLATLLGGLPKRPGPSIDLMILSHIDADHVEGLLALIEEADDLAVGEVWFNGLVHARIAGGQTLPKRDTPWVDCRGRRPQLSIKQGHDFSEALALRGWKWNDALPGGVAMVEIDGALPRIPLPGGGAVTLLGPPRAKLAAFAEEWEFWFDELSKPAKKSLAAKGRRPVPAPGMLEAMARTEDTPDTAKPNGTSITFVIEHADKRVLFCADAHPGDLASALSRYGGDGRIRFDAVKVAHHGSAANNTSLLVNRLESPVWLVSSNGSRYKHPDPEAIARIVLSPLRDKRLLFNYCTPYNKAWADDELAKYYLYRPEFGNGPTVVDLR